MYAKITTTITTLIDLETFEPDYSVEIEAEDGLPTQIIYLSVQGALKSALRAVEKKTEGEGSYGPITDDEEEEN